MNKYVCYYVQEEYADRCGDGELNGVRYFQCGYGKATFYPVARLQPDQKFAESAPAQAGNRVLIDISSL